ncbi:MAG: ethanolamine ammonia-lyase reactivating factor EutA [Clostridia bacterium]|nr:ethanolamine ammonia-lyase reactivating factor EutA [Clostridia bacterium]
MEQQLLSVGIDIGTSTTQLIFSKLTVKNTVSSFNMPKVLITDKEIVYRSKIYFTPLIDHRTINCEDIKVIINKEYENAGVSKEQIDTGAVIITGETARKQNAEDVLSTLSSFAGDFVVATAGADLESIISGKGAGACEYSKIHKKSVLNIDIGGGTSNFALFKNGEVADTGCMNVGGRLLKLDGNNKITYISPVISSIEGDLSIGDVLTEQRATKITDKMTKALMQGANLMERDGLFNHFLTNKGIDTKHHIDCITFSGGVSDIIYNNNYNNIFEYGDIGIILGKSILSSPLVSEYELVRGNETIRATVVGAGSHTTEISGSTITYTKDLLPLKNIPVLKLTEDDEMDLINAISKKLEWYKDEGGVEKIALAFKGMLPATFLNIKKYADEILEGLKNISPLIIVTEKDMAKVLGQTLQSKTNMPVVCIDSVSLSDGDYIDIGKPIADGIAVPVVIKTLVFN